MVEDSFSRFNQITKEELLALVKEVGNANHDNPFEDAQNSSPTMQEFIDLHCDYEDKMTFSGYVVRLPRSDYRVTVEAINFSGLTKDEIISLMENYAGSADDFGVDSEQGNLWFWWD